MEKAFLYVVFANIPGYIVKTDWFNIIIVGTFQLREQQSTVALGWTSHQIQ